MDPKLVMTMGKKLEGSHSERRPSARLTIRGLSLLALLIFLCSYFPAADRAEARPERSGAVISPPWEIAGGIERTEGLSPLGKIPYAFIKGSEGSRDGQAYYGHGRSHWIVFSRRAIRIFLDGKESGRSIVEITPLGMSRRWQSREKIRSPERPISSKAVTRANGSPTTPCTDRWSTEVPIRESTSSSMAERDIWSMTS